MPADLLNRQVGGMSEMSWVVAHDRLPLLLGHLVDAHPETLAQPDPMLDLIAVTTGLRFRAAHEIDPWRDPHHLHTNGVGAVDHPGAPANGAQLHHQLPEPVFQWTAPLSRHLGRRVKLRNEAQELTLLLQNGIILFLQPISCHESGRLIRILAGQRCFSSTQSRH
jgi:hypothetical protein